MPARLAAFPFPTLPLHLYPILNLPYFLNFPIPQVEHYVRDGWIGLKRNYPSYTGESTTHWARVSTRKASKPAIHRGSFYLHPRPTLGPAPCPQQGK